MTIEAPPSFLDMSADAPATRSLLQRFLDTIIEARRRKAEQFVTEYLRERRDILPDHFKIEYERRRPPR